MGVAYHYANTLASTNTLHMVCVCGASLRWLARPV